MTRMFSMSLPTDSFSAVSHAAPCGVAEGTSDARVSDLKEALVQNGKALKAAYRRMPKNGKGCTVPALEWQPAKLW